MNDTQFINAIIAAYAFSKHDIERLATALSQARCESMKASYRCSQRTIGVKVNYEYSEKTKKRIDTQSLKDAKSIVETFKGLLEAFVRQIIDTKKTLMGMETKDWQDTWGDVRDAVFGVIGYIKQFFADLVPWKSRQIVNATNGAGLNDGTTQFIEDVLDADENNDGVVLDDDGEPLYDLNDAEMGVDEIAIQVVPSISSSDYCRLYAGRTFDLKTALAELPFFPVHPNCIHMLMVVPL